MSLLFILFLHIRCFLSSSHESLTILTGGPLCCCLLDWVILSLFHWKKYKIISKQVWELCRRQRVTKTKLYILQPFRDVPYILVEEKNNSQSQAPDKSGSEGRGEHDGVKINIKGICAPNENAFCRDMIRSVLIQQYL